MRCCSTWSEVDHDRRPLGDVPLMVLTQRRPRTRLPGSIPDQAAKLAALLYSMHQEIVALSSRGEHRVVPHAGHGIQFDAPQAVIDAVDEVVTEARRQ